MIYTESPRRKLITKHVAWGHWFTFANILIAIVVSSVYLFSSPIADTPISFVYLITTWLGHTSFITFLCFIVLVLPLCYQVSNTKVLKTSASVIAAVGIALLAFDALLFNKTGFHVSFSSAEMLRSETQGKIGAFGWLQWFYLTLLFVIWLMCQLVIANAIYKRLERLQRIKGSPYIIVSLVLCFVTSHAIHVWADARLYTPVLKQDNMFPLSYPATAKTLMARYGLLDLQDRQQREELQYNSNRQRFNYPPKAVYCSVDDTQKVVVIATEKALSKAFVSTLETSKFVRNQYHLSIMSGHADWLSQLFYGIPNSLTGITSTPPVLLDLLNAFNIPVMVYLSDAENASKPAQNKGPQAFWSLIQNNLTKNYEQFTADAITSENGLYIALVSEQEFSSFSEQAISNAFFNSTSDIILIAKDSTHEHLKIHSNIADSLPKVSSNEDIAPTILSSFACNAESERYTTGQALQNPIRDWLVSTAGSDIVVVRPPYLTRVSRDGSFEVTELSTQTKVLADIDTNLLSRSIKHLKDFSD